MSECGGCTLCCKMLDVPWMDAPSGNLCVECSEGVGCRIFATADPRCRSFACVYRQSDKCGDELRPDRCRVVFEKLSDTMMFGSAVGPNLADAAARQVEVFNRQGFDVVVDDHARRKLIVAPAKGNDAKGVMGEFKAWQRQRTQRT